MENITLESGITAPTIVEDKKIEYSFIEKFFLINPEWKISRGQYFLRSLILSILIGIVCFVTYNFILRIAFIIPGILFYIILITIIFIYYQGVISLMVKRCHDFNSNGKIIRVLVTLGFLAPIVYKMLPVFFIGMIPEWEREFGGDGSILYILYDSLGVVWILSWFTFIILVIILLVLSGSEEQNTPEVDPSDDYHTRRGKALLWFFFRE